MNDDAPNIDTANEQASASPASVAAPAPSPPTTKKVDDEDANAIDSANEQVSAALAKLGQTRVDAISAENAALEAVNAAVGRRQRLIVEAAARVRANFLDGECVYSFQRKQFEPTGS